MNTLEQLSCGDLQGATRLALSEGLTEFPQEIFGLADTLEYLDLSGNALTSLPEDFARLHRLQVLFCAGNRFTELPAVLGQCKSLSMVGFRTNQITRIQAAALPPKLRWLILTGNQLAELPSEIGLCTELQKVALSGNRLTALPAEMAACTKLELLRIGANCFESLPAWLLQMPRLSWLGYSGNPVCAEVEQKALLSFASDNEAATHEFNTSKPQGAPGVKQIPWSSLQLKQKLGEGASGVIYQATLTSAAREVAVKVFKGALTSDGLPHSEIAAYLSAGAHPYLINLLGKVTGHPEGTEALVMQLVDSSYRNLAAPPSLQSCSRDVYSPDLRFSLHDALRLAKGVASMAQQLHRRGLTHGDLYGHNTLIGDHGHAVLGDFGAAAFYDQSDLVVAKAIEQIEVRAFGCLLEELLERVDLEPDDRMKQKSVVQKAEALRDSCLLPKVIERPLFATIEKALSELLKSVSY